MTEKSRGDRLEGLFPRDFCVCFEESYEHQKEKNNEREWIFL